MKSSDAKKSARKPKKAIPMVVGLTGGVGSGKTLVANELSELGAIILSGDEIGHWVVDTNKELQKRLARVFGDGILSGESVNRRKLARRAFSSPENHEMLNRIVHPYLLRELVRQLKKLLKKAESPMIVVDAALLVEWGPVVPLEFLVAVWASRDRRRRWLKKRGWSNEEITARMRAQLPFTKRMAVADHVFRNDGTRIDLRKKVHRLWQKLLARH